MDEKKVFFLKYKVREFLQRKKSLTHIKSDIISIIDEAASEKDMDRLRIVFIKYKLKDLAKQSSRLSFYLKDLIKVIDGSMSYSYLPNLVWRSKHDNRRAKNFKVHGE